MVDNIKNCDDCGKSSEDLIDIFGRQVCIDCKAPLIEGMSSYKKVIRPRTFRWVYFSYGFLFSISVISAAVIYGINNIFAEHAAYTLLSRGSFILFFIIPILAVVTVIIDRFLPSFGKGVTASIIFLLLIFFMVVSL